MKLKLPFECQHTTSMNPSQRQQTKSELSDQQQRLQKGEGPIRNKDLREKEDYDRRGSAREAYSAGGDKQHWSV